MLTASSDAIIGNARLDDAGVAGGSHQAFMAGLHASMVVAAVAATIGAVLALFVRRGPNTAP